MAKDVKYIVVHEELGTCYCCVTKELAIDAITRCAEDLIKNSELELNDIMDAISVYKVQQELEASIYFDISSI